MSEARREWDLKLESTGSDNEKQMQEICGMVEDLAKMIKGFEW